LVVNEVDAMGPIGYLVVEFPGNRMTGEAFPLLVDLVDRGLIRILDLLFIRKDHAGSVSAVELSELDPEGDLHLSVFEGASSGLLGEDDLSEAGGAIEANSSAGILIYENRWAAPFVHALRQADAQLVASGYIPLEDVAAALDAVEARG
jgi:Family of unknown function (DUF6325)